MIVRAINVFSAVSVRLARLPETAITLFSDPSNMWLRRLIFDHFGDAWKGGGAPVRRPGII